jgi:hypothetical protein
MFGLGSILGTVVASLGDLFVNGILSFLTGLLGNILPVG